MLTREPQKSHAALFLADYSTTFVGIGGAIFLELHVHVLHVLLHMQLF